MQNLYTIIRGMIREEIDKTPGFRELTSRPDVPSNIDAEKVILGCVLLDNNTMDCLKELKPDDFSLDSHRLIFLRMRELIDTGRPVDIVTLSHELSRYKEVKSVGGVAYLASLTEGLPRCPVPPAYVAIVQEKAKLRRIICACSAAIAAAAQQDTFAEEIVSKLGQALKGIRGKAAK